MKKCLFLFNCNYSYIRSQSHAWLTLVLRMFHPHQGCVQCVQYDPETLYKCTQTLTTLCTTLMSVTMLGCLTDQWSNNFPGENINSVVLVNKTKMNYNTAIVD